MSNRRPKSALGRVTMKPIEKYDKFDDDVHKNVDDLWKSHYGVNCPYKGESNHSPPKLTISPPKNRLNNKEKKELVNKIKSRCQEISSVPPKSADFHITKAFNKHHDVTTNGAGNNKILKSPYISLNIHHDANEKSDEIDEVEKKKALDSIGSAMIKSKRQTRLDILQRGSILGQNGELSKIDVRTKPATKSIASEKFERVTSPETTKKTHYDDSLALNNNKEFSEEEIEMVIKIRQALSHTVAAEKDTQPMTSDNFSPSNPTNEIQDIHLDYINADIRETTSMHIFQLNESEDPTFIPTTNLIDGDDTVFLPSSSAIRLKISPRHDNCLLPPITAPTVKPLPSIQPTTSSPSPQARRPQSAAARVPRRKVPVILADVYKITNNNLQLAYQPILSGDKKPTTYRANASNANGTPATPTTQYPHQLSRNKASSITSFSPLTPTNNSMRAFSKDFLDSETLRQDLSIFTTQIEHQPRPQSQSQGQRPSTGGLKRPTRISGAPVVVTIPSDSRGSDSDFHRSKRRSPSPKPPLSPSQLRHQAGLPSPTDTSAARGRSSSPSHRNRSGLEREKTPSSQRDQVLGVPVELDSAQPRLPMRGDEDEATRIAVSGLFVPGTGTSRKSPSPSHHAATSATMTSGDHVLGAVASKAELKLDDKEKEELSKLYTVLRTISKERTLDPLETAATSHCLLPDIRRLRSMDHDQSVASLPSTAPMPTGTTAAAADNSNTTTRNQQTHLPSYMADTKSNNYRRSSFQHTADFVMRSSHKQHSNSDGNNDSSGNNNNNDSKPGPGRNHVPILMGGNFLDALKAKKKNLKAAPVSNNDKTKLEQQAKAEAEALQDNPELRRKVWQQLRAEVVRLELEVASGSVEFGKLLGRGKFAAVHEGVMVTLSTAKNMPMRSLLLDRMKSIKLSRRPSRQDEAAGVGVGEGEGVSGSIGDLLLDQQENALKIHPSLTDKSRRLSVNNSNGDLLPIRRRSSIDFAALLGSQPSQSQLSSLPNTSVTNCHCRVAVAIKQAQFRDTVAEASLKRAPSDGTGSGIGLASTAPHPRADAGEVTSMPPVACAEEYLREILALSELSHPCIVSLLGVMMRPKLSLVLELMECSLATKLDDMKWKVETPPYPKLKLTLDVVSALEFMHSRGYVHRDIKSQNILLCAGEEGLLAAKLSDFGSARRIQEGEQLVEAVGTSGYTAPEVFVPGRYDHQADIFSLAVVVWELFDKKGVNNFCGRDPFEVADEMLTGARPCLGKEHPPVVRELVEACWRSEPHSRPKAVTLSYILRKLLVSPITHLQIFDEAFADALSHSLLFEKGLGAEGAAAEPEWLCLSASLVDVPDVNNFLSPSVRDIFLDDNVEFAGFGRLLEDKTGVEEEGETVPSTTAAAAKTATTTNITTSSAVVPVYSSE